MVTSVGIFFVNADNRILIGHPTYSSDGSGFWTIPKGKMDEGETEEQTAKREFFEESGFVIDGFPDGTLEHLGSAEYKHKKKRIVAFYFKTNMVPPRPVCLSYLDHNGERIPEIDRFMWVTYTEALEKLHYAQVEILKQHKDKFDVPK